MRIILKDLWYVKAKLDLSYSKIRLGTNDLHIKAIIFHRAVLHFKYFKVQIV